MINLYHTDENSPVLIYRNFSDDFSKLEELGLTLVLENASIVKFSNIPIVKYEDLILQVIFKHHTNDMKLFEEGIDSFDKLSYCMDTIEAKVCPLPSNIRKLVIKKYEELVKFLDKKD